MMLSNMVHVYADWGRYGGYLCPRSLALIFDVTDKARRSATGTTYYSGWGLDPEILDPR